MTIFRLLRVLSIAFVILGGLSFTSLFILNEGVEQHELVIGRQMEFQSLENDLLSASDYLTTEVRNYVQYGEKEYYDNYWKEVNETKTRDRVVQRLQELNAPQELLDLVETAKKNSDTLIGLEDEAMKAVEQQDFEKARMLVFGDDYKKGKELITKPLVEFEEKLNTMSKEEANQASKRMNFYLTITIITNIFVVSSILGAFFVIFRKLKPLHDVTQVAKQVAAGNLNVNTLSVTSKDEVAQVSQSINEMVHNLRTLIQEIVNTSDQVASYSKELMASASQTNRATEHIASTIEEVAAGADDQVRGIEETSSVINQMSASLIEIEANTQSVMTAAQDTTGKANSGRNSIQTAERQMISIQQNVASLANLVQGLGERSQQIGQILEVITGIAAQTNLLALNAAIEAARAGEHGRGFAVVADEVRKLAVQSGTSAQQISDLIIQIQKETDRAVDSMGIVTTDVSQGIEVVNLAGASFGQIQQSVKEVSLQVEQVAAAIQEMSSGAQHVVQNIETISKVIEETADGTQSVSVSTEEQLTSMEEINASADSLSQMAQELQHLVSKFNITPKEVSHLQTETMRQRV